MGCGLRRSGEAESPQLRYSRAANRSSRRAPAPRPLPLPIPPPDATAPRAHHPRPRRWIISASASEPPPAGPPL